MRPSSWPRWLQAATSVSLVAITAIAILGAFVLYTFDWTPIKHDGEPVGESITEEMELNMERVHISPELQAEIDKMSADRAADYEESSALFTNQPLPPPPEATEPAAAEDEDEAADSGDDYEPEPTYKYHIHGWYNMILLAQLGPLFLMGFTAIVLRYFSSISDTAPGAYKIGHYIRYILNLPLIPAKVPFTSIRVPLHHYVNYAFNGCTIIEFLLYAWLLIVPWIWMGYDIRDTIRDWNRGEVGWTPPGIDNPTYHQHVLNNVAIDFGVLYMVIGPLLFLPAARGSLVNSFLGVHYGTMIKWHRWVGVMTVAYLLLHGVLYHALWASAGSEVYKKEAYLWKGYISNLAGLFSWIGMVMLAAPAIPWFRRRFYFIFYNMHVVGALTFIVFGILHWNGNFACSMLGLAVWGMDVAYRLYQTTYMVDLRLEESEGSRIISVVIPLEEGHSYHDGCHVWICFPDIQRLRYHPFSIASCSGDPVWKHHLLVQTKVYDKWTKMVSDRVAHGNKGGQQLTAHVQGPFDGHTWALGHENTYSKIIFASGGIGCTGILSHLQRAAMRRASGEDGPPICLIHTCRDVAEIQVLAPVLVYSNHIDVRIHYTGKTALSARTLEAPNPSTANVYSSGDAAAVAEGGGNIHPSTDDPVTEGRGLIHPNGNWTLELVLLSVTIVAAYWLYAAPEFWFGKNIFASMYILPKNTVAHRAAQMNALAMFCFFVLIPVVPLLIITVWRTIGRRLRLNTQAVHGAGGMVQNSSGSIKSGSDQTSGNKAGSGRRSDDTGAPMDVSNATLFLAESDGHVSLSSAAVPSSSIPIIMGRPNFAPLMAELVDGCTGTVGLWAAGPKKFNWAVSEAARASACKVDVSQMAFEL